MATRTLKSLNLSVEQVELLEDSFKKISKHPDGATLMLIAAESGLSEEETHSWFERRNEQWRQAEGLPPKQGSVLD